MSTRYTRNLIRQKTDDFIAANFPGVVFIDSVNFNTAKPLAAEFVTVEFTAIDNILACYSGEKNIETGLIEILAFTKPGAGDERALEIVEALKTHFQTFNNGVFAVLNISPPNDYVIGTAQGNHYAATVAMNYERYY